MSINQQITSTFAIRNLLFRCIVSGLAVALLSGVCLAEECRVQLIERTVEDIDNVAYGVELKMKVRCPALYKAALPATPDDGFDVTSVEVTDSAKTGSGWRVLFSHQDVTLEPFDGPRCIISRGPEIGNIMVSMVFDRRVTTLLSKRESIRLYFEAKCKMPDTTVVSTQFVSQPLKIETILP